MKARDALKVADIALDALDGLERLTHIGGDGAVAALAAIRGIVHSLQEAAGGKITPQAALSQIEALTQALLANDAGADAAVGTKFGGTP